MLFFFKEKPIEIVAFVTARYNFAKEFSPFSPAREYFPEWWKKTPSSSYNWSTGRPDNTTKSCPGIIGVLTNGFILPLWCDLAFAFGPEGYKYHFSDGLSRMDIHDDIQTPGFYTEYYHLKIHSPWIIRSPVKIMFQQPTYLRENEYPFITPYGIVTPVKNLFSTNIFTFFKKPEQDIHMFIKQGTPLLHIVPLTERKITLKLEVLDNDDYLKAESIICGTNHFSSKGLRNIRISEKQ
jgi:hypothetical protein